MKTACFVDGLEEYGKDNYKGQGGDDGADQGTDC